MADRSRGGSDVSWGRWRCTTGNLLLFAALLVCLPGRAGAASPAGVPPHAVSPTDHAPIPPAELTAELQAARVELQRLRESSDESDQTVEILSGVEEAEAGIGSWVEHDEDELGDAITPDRLEELQIRWTRRGGALESWDATLSERVQELSDNLVALDHLEGPWKATYAVAAENQLAEPVVVRIQSTLSEISTTRVQAQVERNSVLTLQGRLAKLAETSDDVLRRLGEVRRAQQQNLMAVDSVPLWTALGRFHGEGDPFEALRASVGRAGDQVTRYFTATRNRVIGFVLATAVLAVLVRVLRIRTAAWAAEDSRLAPMLDSLARPVSAGFLLATLFFPQVFSDRPAVVANLVTLLVIPPLIRFLSPLISPRLRAALYALALWMLVDLVRNHLIAAPVPARLLLFVVGLVVAGAMVRLLRQVGPQDLGGVFGSARWVAPGLRVGVAVLGAALLANLFGNVTLAEMLTNTLRFSLLAAAVVLASLRVIEFLVAASLRLDLMLRLGMVRRHGALLRQRLVWLARVALVSFWVVLTLRRLQLFEPLMDSIRWLLAMSFGAGDFELTLGDLVGAVLVFVTSIYLARLTRFVLEEDVLPRTRLPRGVPYTVSVLAGYGIIVLGAFASVAAAGIDMSRFALVLSALSVGIGIGLQDVVNNFVSGLILLFERPLKVGDTVEVADVRGEIRHIGLRSSTVRTWDGSEVVIPNARFIADQFTNWTLSDRVRRVEMSIGVAYGTDPVRVIEILTGVAEADDRVLRDPAPRAIMTGFGESSLDFSFRIWTADIDNWTLLRSDVVIEVNRRLAAAGIVIPFPQRHLHIAEPHETS